jgi:hypothetical protein
VASPGVEAAEDGALGQWSRSSPTGSGQPRLGNRPTGVGEQEHEPAALAVNARSGGGVGRRVKEQQRGQRPAPQCRKARFMGEAQVGRGLTLLIIDGLGVVGLVAGHLWSYRWCQPPPLGSWPSPGQWSGRTEHKTPDLILGVPCLAQLVDHRGRSEFQSQSSRLKSRYRPPDRTTSSTTEATNPECWANPG